MNFYKEDTPSQIRSKYKSMDFNNGNNMSILSIGSTQDSSK